MTPHNMVMTIKHTSHLLGMATLFIGSTCFLAPAGQAGSLRLSTWSADGWEASVSSDTLTAGKSYAMSRELWFNTGVESSSDPDGVTSVTGVVFTCTIPSNEAPLYFDFDEDMPFYAQWFPAYTTLIYKAANPLGTNEWWSSNLELAGTNAWSSPKFSLTRTVSTTTLLPNQETNQIIVCNLTVPSGALSGMAMFSIQLNFWDMETDGLSINCYSNCCSTSAFTINSNNNQPSFVCMEPGSLGGSYSFTNYVRITSYSDKAMNLVPSVQVIHSRTQSEWSEHSTIPSPNFSHEYDNGTHLGISSQDAAVWTSQTAQDYTCWNLRGRYAPVGNDQPGAVECVLFRSRCTCCDGQICHQFFANVAGTNLVNATLTTPDNTTFDMEVESDEADFEAASLNADDLARFTNGTYTIKLYDFNNVLRKTYAYQLTGSPVTEAPHLLTPNALCSSDATPYLSWETPSDGSVNAVVLDIENSNLEDEIFEIMTDDPVPTHFQVEQGQELAAGWSYELMFASASMTMQDGVQVMSGYLSSLSGFANVAEKNPTFAYAETDVPRVFAGNDLELSLFSFGFLPGSSYTYSVDFGDGYTTNDLWGVHRYTTPGNYTARVIVTDNTGVSTTGTVAMAAYALPSISTASHVSSDIVDIQVPTIDGAEYTLHYTDDLSNADWSGVVYSLLGDGTTQTFHDQQIVPVSQRFYKLECELNP